MIEVIRQGDSIAMSFSNADNTIVIDGMKVTLNGEVMDVPDVEALRQLMTKVGMEFNHTDDGSIMYCDGDVVNVINGIEKTNLWMAGDVTNIENYELGTASVIEGVTVTPYDLSDKASKEEYFTGLGERISGILAQRSE